MRIVIAGTVPVPLKPPAALSVILNAMVLEEYKTAIP